MGNEQVDCIYTPVLCGEKALGLLVFGKLTLTRYFRIKYIRGELALQIDPVLENRTLKKGVASHT